MFLARACYPAGFLSGPPLLLGCAHGKTFVPSIFHVCCVYVQDKRAALQQFNGSIYSPATAMAVTVPQLLTLTACLSVDDPVAAHHYCGGLVCVAGYGDATCADVIMSAGCIPHVIDCLRRWPADWNVVTRACWALAGLAENGSASVRAAIKHLPGIQTTLQAAKESVLDNGHAARALSALGL